MRTFVAELKQNEDKHDQTDSKCMVVASLKIQKVVRREPCVLLR